MRKNIIEVLAAGEVIVADGAMGTLLHQRGLPAGVMPEVWNEQHPEVVQGIHQDYLDLGVRLIGANTFGGNRIRLGEAGLSTRSAELVRLGVRLAREAAGDRAWVAGSVGPTGKLMEPLGDLTVAEAEDVFAEEIEALAEAGVDVILVETQQDIDEASCAVRVAAQRTNLPVWCSFAFNRRGRTIMGLRPGEAARRAREAGASVVGANCGDGPQAIRVALEGMSEAGVPLIGQSNAGIPQLGADAETEWDVTPEELAQEVLEFVRLGARVVGGCCGTTPAHMAAILAALGAAPSVSGV